MATLSLKWDVCYERSIEGIVLSVHVLPSKSAHCLTGGVCWCKPRKTETVDDLIYETYGVKVWIHHPYTPRGENGPRSPLDMALV